MIPDYKIAIIIQDQSVYFKKTNNKQKKLIINRINFCPYADNCHCYFLY